MTAKAYLGDIIGGSIMLRESRVVAELLLQHPDEVSWSDAIVNENALQKTSVHSAKRMASTLRKRLEPMGRDFWTALLQVSDDLAKQMLLLATICQSPVLGDFMATVVSDARRMYRESLRSDDWQEFFCLGNGLLMALNNFQRAQFRKWGITFLRSWQMLGILSLVVRENCRIFTCYPK